MVGLRCSDMEQATEQYRLMAQHVAADAEAKLQAWNRFFPHFLHDMHGFACFEPA